MHSSSFPVPKELELYLQPGYIGDSGEIASEAFKGLLPIFGKVGGGAKYV